MKCLFPSFNSANFWILVHLVYCLGIKSLSHLLPETLAQRPEGMLGGRKEVLRARTWVGCSVPKCAIYHNHLTHTSVILYTVYSILLIEILLARFPFPLPRDPWWSVVRRGRWTRHSGQASSSSRPCLPKEARNDVLPLMLVMSYSNLQEWFLSRSCSIGNAHINTSSQFRVGLNPGKHCLHLRSVCKITLEKNIV